LIEGGRPRFGSFRGGLPRLDFGDVPRGRVWRLTHGKRWSYAMVADDAVLLGSAVVSVGYAATALVFVLDRRAGKMLVDHSVMGPSSAITFTDEGDGRRAASFRQGRTRVRIADDGVTIDLPPGGGSLLPGYARFVASGPVAPPIGAVVPIEGGFANATEKRLLLGEGEVVAGGRRFVLSDPICGLDHPAGFLARHTAWRWAFGAGRARSGERVAFNLVQGFVGEPECGLWIDGALFPCEEAAFSYDIGAPLEPWRVRSRCGSVDVTFAPAAVHAEHKDLLLVRSRFIQPAGAFSGTLTAGGRVVEVSDLAGVTEHQDVVW